MVCLFEVVIVTWQLIVAMEKMNTGVISRWENLEKIISIPLNRTLLYKTCRYPLILKTMIQVPSHELKRFLFQWLG